MKYFFNPLLKSGFQGYEFPQDAYYFNLTPAITPTAVGSFYWDNNDNAKTLAINMEGGVTQQVGEETYFRVKATAAIANGQVVMATGTIGSSGTIAGAPATGLTADSGIYIIGVATQDIPLNGWGYVTCFGLVRNINTTGGAEAWTDGTVLYYNPAVVGGLTKNIPTAPNAKVVIAMVVHAANNGSLFIRLGHGSVLGGTDGNVQFTSLADGDLIVYNSTTARWENLAKASITVGNADKLDSQDGSYYLNWTNFINTPTTLAGYGVTLSASDVPSFDASKITSGILDQARLPSYVDDVLEYANQAAFPVTGETGKIYVALDTNKTYRWSGSTYIYITSGAVDSVAGKTGVVTLAKADVGLSNVDNTADANKSVATAAKWTNARTFTIGSTGKSVDGSGNVSWSLSEIGAAAETHSHNYLPLTGGTLTGALSAPDFNTTSDVNLKTNIYTISNAVSKVKLLRGVTFNWKQNGKPSLGVIAQELEAVLPELVHDVDGHKAVSYGNIVGLLIEAVKEQQILIEQLMAQKESWSSK